MRHQWMIWLYRDDRVIDPGRVVTSRRQAKMAGQRHCQTDPDRHRAIFVRWSAHIRGRRADSDYVQFLDVVEHVCTAAGIVRRLPLLSPESGPIEPGTLAHQRYQRALRNPRIAKAR